MTYRGIANPLKIGVVLVLVLLLVELITATMREQRLMTECHAAFPTYAEEQCAFLVHNGFYR